MFPILSAYLTFRNGFRAKANGQNPVLYGFATITAIFFCLVVGGIFVALIFCGDAINMIGLSSFDATQRLEAAHKLQHALAGNPMHLITVELIAMGGYLFIRRLIEKEVDLKHVEIDWIKSKQGNG